MTITTITTTTTTTNTTTTNNTTTNNNNNNANTKDRAGDYVDGDDDNNANNFVKDFIRCKPSRIIGNIIVTESYE